MQLKIKKLNPLAQIPTYAHLGDAGFDVRAIENTVIKPGERKGIPTGLALEIPEGHVGLVWDKSGLALKNGITNFAGVIDAGYRGEWSVVLYNAGAEDFVINAGDKLAQMLIQKIERVEIVEATELSDTARADGGFGSTGK